MRWQIVFLILKNPNILNSLYTQGLPKPSDKELMDDFHRIEEPSYRIKIQETLKMSVLDSLLKGGLSNVSVRGS